VGTVAISDLKAIAEIKMADLNANTIDQAVSMMMGTCVSMGIEVKGK
jgi:large subunit ribosomal protein L11